MSHFDTWKSQVDVLFVDIFGLDTDDVEDWNWYDAYTEALSPKEAIDAWCEEHGF